MASGMDCNRDEAERAKHVAERKFLARDVFGARKFALKAQNLFPGLKGISSMLATFNVCIAAESKIYGEADWYGILGVDPLADEENLRKQYRKLAIMLHPDKNKSVGADAAFKLISEAWSLLSDKSKRMAYDLKRNIDVQKVPAPGGGPSVVRRENNMHKPSKTSSNSNCHRSTIHGSHSSPSAASPKAKPKTFWTVCRVCKMQYEYLRIYLNHKLLCPNCHEPFLAEESAPPPSNISKPPPSWNFSDKECLNHYKAGKVSMKNSHIGSRRSSSTESYKYKQSNYHWTPFSKNDGVPTAAQAASMVQEAYAKVKRAREEAQSKLKDPSQQKQQASKKPGISASVHLHPSKKRRYKDNTNMSSKGKKFVRSGLVNSSNIKVDIQKLLIDKARNDIRMRLKEMKSTIAAKATIEEGVNGPHTSNEGGVKGLGRFDDFVEIESGNFKDQVSLDDPEVMSIDVPDPEFCDFDKDRTGRAFVKNEVWAAYDNHDGMPRYYAFIQSVISTNPFKIRISWLNSTTVGDLASLKWSLSGFTRTIGHFRIGRYEISKSLNSFSHKVRWRKDIGGAICIYPRRGEVWALYRNWSPGWNELTATGVIHKYEMVEVVDGFTEEHGVAVIPLVKVAGFKTVFHRHLNMREIKRITRREMHHFSHCVPAHWLTGQEAPNAPKGCWELDPAATPSDLLQIIRHVKDEDLVGFDNKDIEATSVDNVEVHTHEDMLDDVITCSGEAETENITAVQHVEIVSG